MTLPGGDWLSKAGLINLGGARTKVDDYKNRKKSIRKKDQQVSNAWASPAFMCGHFVGEGRLRPLGHGNLHASIRKRAAGKVEQSVTDRPVSDTCRVVLGMDMIGRALS